MDTGYGTQGFVIHIPYCHMAEAIEEKTLIIMTPISMSDTILNSDTSEQSSHIVVSQHAPHFIFYKKRKKHLLICEVSKNIISDSGW